jgi:hypothetical protein
VPFVVCGKGKRKRKKDFLKEIWYPNPSTFDK